MREGCFQNQAQHPDHPKLRVVGLSQSGGAEGQREKWGAVCGNVMSQMGVGLPAKQLSPRY